MIRLIALLTIIALQQGKLTGQILPSFGNSRTGTAGMQFLKVMPDARGNSLAGSYVAQADDAMAMFWNPAGITQVSTERLHIQADQTRYFAGINISSIAAVYRPGQQTFWGVYSYVLSTPEMNETTEFQPEGTGRTFRSQSSLTGLTYARILTNAFSFGVNAKFAREAYSDVSINNVMFDLGIRYNIGVKNARFAVTLSNFGINVQPSGEVTRLRHNGTESVDNFERISVPAIFRIGAAFDPISKENHVLTISGQLNHPTDNNETVAFGAEYLLRKVLVLRSGYEFGSDVSGFPPLGMGVILKRKFGSLRIDYGFSHKQRLGQIHRVGIQVSLL